MDEETKTQVETTEDQVKEESNWLKQEVENLKDTVYDEDRKPALKLEENKIVEMTVNFSTPFQKWEDAENKTVKKIIPVTVGAAEFVWWLNVKNPVYSEIIRKGAEGKTIFKILQTGSQKNTKYTIVEE